MASSFFPFKLQLMASCTQKLNFAALRKSCSKRRLEGIFLMVAKVPFSNCIFVKNLQPSTSHEFILFYFENKRSGGGEVERMEMNTTERCCLVYFVDHNVIDTVLCQQHKIDGADIEVHRHYECLGRRSSRSKSDPFLAVSKSENKENLLKAETSSSGSSSPDKGCDYVETPKWQEDDGKNCLLPLWIKYKRASERTIFRDMKKIPCSRNFHLFWNFFTKTKQGQQILNDILKKCGCSVTVSSDDDELFIFEIFDESFEKESEVTDFIKVAFDNVYAYAHRSLFSDIFLIDHRMLEDILQSIKQINEMDNAWIELVGEQEPDALCVVCTEKDKAAILQVVTAIKNTVQDCFENHEDVVTIDPMWQKVLKKFGYLQEISEKFPNLTMTLDETRSTVTLKGPRDQSSAAARHLKELLVTAHAEIQEDIFSPGCQFDIFAYPEMCDYIDNCIIKLPFVWIPNHHTMKIHLFFKKSEQIMGMDKCIKGCIKERPYPFTKDQSACCPKITRSLEELKNKHKGKIVINQSPTRIIVTTADDIFECVDAVVEEIISTEAGKFHPAHVPEKHDGIDKIEDIMKSGSIFKRIRVKVQKGQLHEAQAQVFVNTVGRNLDLLSGVTSASLLVRAGKGIQKELQSYGRNILFGQVLRTGAGVLPKPCMAIFHGVLHGFKEHSDYLKVFESFILGCLLDANKKKYRSIAFPPIGTGKLCYPKDLVASEMFQSVAKFDKAHPTSTLEEVIFVIDERDQETLKIFQHLLQSLQSGPREDDKRLQLCTKPLTAEPLQPQVFENSLAQLKTAVDRPMKERDLLTETIQSLEGSVCEENEHAKMTGEEEKLQCFQEHVLQIKMDDDEYILLCETDFFSKFIGLFKGHSYSRPEMSVTCKREICDEIQNTFEERLKSLRENEKYEIKLEATHEIYKVRECLKDLDVDWIVKKDGSGSVVVMWTTYEEHIKQKNRLRTELGLRETTKTSRKNRQTTTGETRLPAEEETCAFYKAILKGDSQLGSAFETEEGLIIQVHNGDITKLDVDCIVNAANEYLSHGAGVAKAIEDAAGLHYKEDCARSVQVYGLLEEGEVRASTGGDLNCKEILNAVGPRWDSYRDKTRCQEILRETIKKCLEESNNRGYKTIALPSISAGIFGVPVEKCTEEYCQAVISFSKETPRVFRCLKEVHFVDIIQRNVDMILRTFSKLLRKCFTDTPLSHNSPSSLSKMAFSIPLTKNQTMDKSDSSASWSFTSLANMPSIQQGGPLNYQYKSGQEKTLLQNTAHQDKTKLSGSFEFNTGKTGQKLQMMRIQPVAGCKMEMGINLQETEKPDVSVQLKTQQPGSGILLKIEGTMPFAVMSSQGIPTQYPLFTALGGQLQICVAYADITAISVDAIVSTEDPYLCSKGTIARTIRNVAGDGFDRNEFEIARSKTPLELCSIVVTSVRNLHCNLILHTISPHWSKQALKDPQKFEASLSLAVLNILKTAEERKLMSLAIPLLGTSEDEQKMPTPIQTCARGMVTGLLTGLKLEPQRKIAHVKFVSNCPGIVKVFFETLHQHSVQ